MNNWGVPNWRNASEYPNELPPNQWRWQFLRRCKSYREDWLLHFFSSYQHNMNVYRNLPVPEGYETWDEHFRGFAMMPREREKYGIAYLQDPSLSSADPTLFVVESGFLVRHAIPEILEEYDQNDIKLLAIDLKKPLAPQIEKAKKYLSRIQKEVKGEIKSQRNHFEKWPLYLRMLDAEESGETWEEIGKLILADRYLENRATRAYQYYEQAQEIQNRFISV